MNIVQRAVRIITTPSTEWPVAGAEPTSTGQLLTYAAILSALAQVASLAGAAFASGVIAGFGGDTSPVTMAMNTLVVTSVAGWVVGLVVLYIMALIASSLAGGFDGRKDTLQGLKLATYASTPVWVFGLLGFVPILGWVALIAGYVYAIYLIYRGAPHTVGVPPEKAGGYTAVVTILWLILGMVLGGIVAFAVLGSMVAGQGGAAY